MTKRTPQRVEFHRDIISHAADGGSCALSAWADVEERRARPALRLRVLDRIAVEDHGAAPDAARHTITAAIVAKGVAAVLANPDSHDPGLVERVRACSAANTIAPEGHDLLDSPDCDDIVQIGLFGEVRHA